MHLQGTTDANGLRIAIVVSRFNDFVTDRLLAGAKEALGAAGADAVDTVSVPGAYEIPQAARAAASTGSYDAVVCLGCLIRGKRRTSSTSRRRWPTASCRPRRKPASR